VWLYDGLSTSHQQSTPTPTGIPDRHGNELGSAHRAMQNNNAHLATGTTVQRRNAVSYMVT
jgi:hypothetical protein